jgi:hypothetical protein
VIAEAIEEMEILGQIRVNFLLVVPVFYFLAFSFADECHRAVNVLVVYRILSRSMCMRPTVEKEKSSRLLGRPEID